MLYTSGRQFTDEPDKYGGLREPGAFVEVPGRVVSQRTHQSLRSASYRGWIQAKAAFLSKDFAVY